METFVAVLHITVALILIILVLIQDSKGGSVGGAFGGGGGGSNSVLGATGATTIAQKMTRWTAVIFACTSIGLTAYSAKKHRSVVDGMPAAAPVENSAANPIDAAQAPVAVPTNAVPSPSTPTETK